MQNKNYRYIISAIKEAIDILEFKAYQNNYKTDTKHKELIAYLEKTSEELKKMLKE